MTKRGPNTMYYCFTGTNKSVYGQSIYSLDTLCLFVSNTVPNSSDLHTKLQSQWPPFSSFPSQDILQVVFFVRNHTLTHMYSLYLDGQCSSFGSPWSHQIQYSPQLSSCFLICITSSLKKNLYIN